MTEVDWNGRMTGFCGNSGKAETPQERMRRGGSAHAPRKASILEWISTYTYLNSNNVYENSQKYKIKIERGNRI